MTEQEAQRILNEHRAECPAFVRGLRRYEFRKDGRVEMWSAVGKSGLRWKYESTIEPKDFWILPSEVRQRAEQV